VLVEGVQKGTSVRFWFRYNRGRFQNGRYKKRLIGHDFDIIAFWYNVLYSCTFVTYHFQRNPSPISRDSKVTVTQFPKSLLGYYRYAHSAEHGSRSIHNLTFLSRTQNATLLRDINPTYVPHFLGKIKLGTTPHSAL